MKDLRHKLYDNYRTDFKKGEKRERYGSLHLRLWYNEKYLPLLKGVPRDARVLEVGCGAGLMMQYLKQAGFANVSGIDISGDQVAEAVARGFDAMDADALEYLPQHPGEFEVIVAMDVIEHFTKDELFKLLSAARAALKPGGLFIVQTPNGEGLLPGYVV